MAQNLQVMIASVPNGPLEEKHFEVRESAAPECPDGAVLCRTLALTIGAGQRAGLQVSADRQQSGAFPVSAQSPGQCVKTVGTHSHR